MGGLFSQPTPQVQNVTPLNLSGTSTTTPGPPRSPPPPSSSTLNPPTSFLSYFSSKPSPSLIHTHLSPSARDISKVKITLQSLGLPPELIPRILDDAGYWTGCRLLNKRRLGVAAGGASPFGPRGDGGWVTGQEDDVERERIKFERGGGGEEDWGLKDGPGEVWYLVTEPLGCSSLVSSGRTEYSSASGDSTEPIDGSAVDPRKERRIWLRELVVETFSKDQGWSSAGSQYYGTYEASYSWFELSLLREGREVEGSRCSFQNNVHAGQYMKSHRNIFTRDHPLVREARRGDRIVLWVRAQYPGWGNQIQEGALTVFTTSHPPYHD